MPSEGPAAPPPSGPPIPPWRDWYREPFETREVRKAQARADRAARRADRAARRAMDAQERADGKRSGARLLVEAAGDAATAALTAVSAAADEAQARLAAKARMRELEHAIVNARAGGPVDVSPPTRDEALKLADRVEPGSSRGTFVHGVGFIVAGIVALAMMQIGGFGWLGLIVPLLIVIAGGSLGNQIIRADRSRKASRLQLELARASLGATVAGTRATTGVSAPIASASAGHLTERPRLLEDGDPRTRTEVLGVLDRLMANVSGWLPDTDVATLRRIRDSAAHALPATEEPLDLTDHDIWLLRQICIDYVPRAIDHYMALPADRASEPLLDGRSARQVLDEQLATIESRLDEMAARMYRREAGELLSHGRFLADTLRPDTFQVWLDGLAASETAPASSAGEPTHASEATVTADQVATEATVTTDQVATRERERA